MTHRATPCTVRQSARFRLILAPSVVLTALALAFAPPVAALNPIALSPGAVTEAETQQEGAVTSEAVQAPAPAPSHRGLTSTAHRPDDIARAMELEARAWAMRDLMDQYRTAARLYREAAALRPDYDRQKVKNLRQASRMSFYSDRIAEASRDAEVAARVALRQGDVLTAADAYVDAAWLAARVGDAARFDEMVEEATLLAGSPLLAELQRERLLRRLEESA